jgi:hypothetical protein
MSQENVELARWAFTSGDPTRFFSLLDEDVEFDASRNAQIPGHATFRRRTLAQWGERCGGVR